MVIVPDQVIGAGFGSRIGTSRIVGGFFGEQALITHEPRSATIIALTDVQLLKFTKHDLAVVVKDHPRVGTLLKKYHEQRISDTLESLKSIW